MRSPQSQFSQPFYTAEVLQPPDHPCCPPPDLFQEFHAFLVLSCTSRAGCSWRWDLTRVEVEKTLLYHSLQDTLPLIQIRILLVFWAASAWCWFTQNFSSTSVPRCFSMGLLSISSLPAYVDAGDCSSPGEGLGSWPCWTSWAYFSRSQSQEDLQTQLDQMIYSIFCF